MTSENVTEAEPVEPAEPQLAKAVDERRSAPSPAGSPLNGRRVPLASCWDRKARCWASVTAAVL